MSQGAIKAHFPVYCLVDVDKVVYLALRIPPEGNPTICFPAHHPNYA